MTQGRLTREALYIEDGASPFFAWHHAAAAPASAASDMVAVVCGPIGSESTRSHRSLRHLADRLAAAGIPAIRFDYHGTGNSPGTDMDPGRVEAWLSNIRRACAFARERSGRTRLVLAGVRLGATFAAVASEAVDPDLLVLWNAPVKGRPYVRELQAIAKLAARASDTDGALEAAGYVMTAETLDALKRIDLLQAPIRARRVLIVARDDLQRDDSLGTHLAAQGIDTETVELPGWNGMMADHQHTVVPDAALDSIVAWIASEAGHASVAPAALADSPQAESITVAIDDGEQGAVMEERLCRFGEDEHLFGVLTRLDDAPTRPVIVMFNGGAVHHVGPNRLYVTLARSLAAMGFACLRFDLEGIGDSVLRKPGRENHPYPDHATEDAKSALAFLRERFGYGHFLALGLCSGAHTAFHSALQLDDDIHELILINPYSFYWKEGMTLDVVTKLADAKQYQKSMRDPSRWLKLLRGDVNMRRLLDVALTYPKTLGKSYYGALCESLLPSKAPPLARDLRRLFDRRRKVTVLLAEGDPGREIIMSEAKWTATRALRDGQMTFDTIAGGDHTFTRSQTRRVLIERLAEHLKPCLEEQGHPVP